MSKRSAVLALLAVALLARWMGDDIRAPREQRAVRPHTQGKVKSGDSKQPAQHARAALAEAEPLSEPAIWLRVVDGSERPVFLASASLFKRDQRDAYEEDFTATASDAQGMLVLSMPDIELGERERLFVRVEVEGHPVRLLSEEEIALALAPSVPYVVRLQDYADIRVYPCNRAGEHVLVGYYGDLAELGRSAYGLSCERRSDAYDMRLSPGVYHFAAAREGDDHGDYTTHRVELKGGERLMLDLRDRRSRLAVLRMTLLGTELKPIQGARFKVVAQSGAAGGFAAWLNGEEQETDEAGHFTLLAARGEALALSLSAPGMWEPEIVHVSPLARTITLESYRPVACQFVDRDGQRTSYRSAEVSGQDPDYGVRFGSGTSEEREGEFVFDWPAVHAPITVSSWGFIPVTLRSFADPCVLVRED